MTMVNTLEVGIYTLRNDWTLVVFKKKWGVKQKADVTGIKQSMGFQNKMEMA